MLELHCKELGEQSYKVEFTLRRARGGRATRLSLSCKAKFQVAKH